MDTQLAIYGLGACLAGQTALALVGIYQWHKWEKRCKATEGGLRATQNAYFDLSDQAHKLSNLVVRRSASLEAHRDLIKSWIFSAKRARQKTSHFVAARTLIDEALKND